MCFKGGWVLPEEPEEPVAEQTSVYWRATVPFQDYRYVTRQQEISQNLSCKARRCWDHSCLETKWSLTCLMWKVMRTSYTGQLASSQCSNDSSFFPPHITQTKVYLTNQRVVRDALCHVAHSSSCIWSSYLQIKVTACVFMQSHQLQTSRMSHDCVGKEMWLLCRIKKLYIYYSYFLYITRKSQWDYNIYL